MNLRNKFCHSLLGGAILTVSANLAFAQGPVPVESSQPIRRASATAPTTTAVAARPLAVVNGEVVSTADLEVALRQAGPTPVALTEAQTKQMKMDFLRMLIDAALMRQFLAKYAPPATPADIDAKLVELEDGLKKQGKSLADHLRETHQSEAMLKAGVGFALQWEHFAQARVTEADVLRFYNEYKDFFDGVTVRASHIVLRLPPNSGPADIEGARAKLTAIRNELLEKKTDFAAMAKAASQCPSKENGGDIGFITRKWGMVDEGFARIAFGLQIGQVSDIVQTEYGLHLIKVTDRKAGQLSDYAKIKEDIRQLYIEEMRQSMLAQQRKAAKLEVQLANLP